MNSYDNGILQRSQDGNWIGVVLLKSQADQGTGLSWLKDSLLKLSRILNFLDGALVLIILSLQWKTQEKQ
jgi:hypothetical protein